MASARKGPVRRLFTDEQILEAASIPMGYKRLGVPRNTFNYWLKQLEFGVIKANRQIRQKVQLKPAGPYNDEVIKPYDYSTERILAIPDLHTPYHHPKAFEFLRRLKKEINPTLVICLGDELDNHTLGFHDSDPNLDAAGRELHEARRAMERLHEIFPQMMICHSNHGSLVYRRAMAHGLPVEMIRTYREIIFPKGGGEGWSWHHRIYVEMPNGRGVVFRHQAPGNLLNAAAHEHASLVCGHLHGKFSIEYSAGERSKFFAIQAGCLIDDKAMAFAYGMENRLKPLLGAVVIENSVPRLIPLE